MKSKIALTKGVIKLIHQAVDSTYDAVVSKFLERPPFGKQIRIGWTPKETLGSIFRAASLEERTKADESVLSNLLDIAVGYVDASRSRTKSQVVQAVEAWMNDAHARGVTAPVETVLGGQLHKIFGEAQRSMHRILDSEATTARNLGTLDGIIAINTASGVEDPIVYKVVVRDADLCETCRRLHLLPDGVTPRVWKLSELTHGYGSKDDDAPTIGPQHPHCRCSIVTVMEGYGFDASGHIDYIAPGHDEYKKQNS